MINCFYNKSDRLYFNLSNSPINVPIMIINVAIIVYILKTNFTHIIILDLSNISKINSGAFNTIFFHS